MSSDVEADETLRLIASEDPMVQEQPRPSVSSRAKIIAGAVLLATCTMMAFIGQNAFSPSSALGGAGPMDFAVKSGTIGQKSAGGYQATFTTSGAVSHYPASAMTPEQKIEEKVGVCQAYHVSLVLFPTSGPLRSFCLVYVRTFIPLTP